jgi:tRNA A37 threonylcarbamoyladenosine synthetase subunit TsaC/SUA5/YrdC
LNTNCFIYFSRSYRSPFLQILNPELNPGTSTVGVRVPDSAFILGLARRLGQPLALTSANLSGQPSALTCEEFQPLWPHLAAVVDAGRLPSSPLTRSGSTVVDLSSDLDPITGMCTGYRVVRDGCALEATAAVLKQFGLMDRT